MITDMSKLHILTNGVWRGNGYLRVSYPEDDEGWKLNYDKILQNV